MILLKSQEYKKLTVRIGRPRTSMIMISKIRLLKRSEWTISPAAESIIIFNVAIETLNAEVHQYEITDCNLQYYAGIRPLEERDKTCLV